MKDIQRQDFKTLAVIPCGKRREGFCVSIFPDWITPLVGSATRDHGQDPEISGAFHRPRAEGYERGSWTTSPGE
jgi:hypothetical protein